MDIANTIISGSIDVTMDVGQLEELQLYHQDQLGQRGHHGHGLIDQEKQVKMDTGKILMDRSIYFDCLLIRDLIKTNFNNRVEMCESIFQ